MEDAAKGEGEKQKRAGGPDQSPPASLTNKEVAANGDENPADRQAESTADVKPKSRWQRFRDWSSGITFSDAVMLLLTSVIAFGTIVSAIAIGLQWREMVGGGKQTDKIISAAQANACAAKSFAASADKINQGLENAVSKLAQQASDAETFFRTDERAWVEIGKIEKTVTFPPNPPIGTIFKFSVYPANVGKTVARDVRIHLENIDAWAEFIENKRAIRMSQDQLFHEQGNKQAIHNAKQPRTSNFGSRANFSSSGIHGGARA